MKKSRRGFSLVELIIVIAIIGILAAILVPQYSGFQDRAREKAAIAEARAVLTAISAYCADNGGVCPSSITQLDNDGHTLYLEGTNYGEISAVTGPSNFVYTNKAGTYRVTVAAGEYNAEKLSHPSETTSGD